jgi:hypothetical protein
MHASELLAGPVGLLIEARSADDATIRFLHWLGYWPQQIEGGRQVLIKMLSPGWAFKASPPEQRRYLEAVRSNLELPRVGTLSAP